MKDDKLQDKFDEECDLWSDNLGYHHNYFIHII